jgi:hypothetical protein
MAVSPNDDFTSGQILTAQECNNFPRGVMGYMTSSTNPTVTTSVADVTGVTVTWTAVANRLYRVTFEGFVGCTTATQNQYFFADASNVTQDSWIQDMGLNTYQPICLVQILTATAGSKTVKLRAQTSAGTLTFFGTSGRQFSMVVEDLGPA